MKTSLSLQPSRDHCSKPIIHPINTAAFRLSSRRNLFSSFTRRNLCFLTIAATELNHSYLTASNAFILHLTRIHEHVEICVRRLCLRITAEQPKASLSIATTRRRYRVTDCVLLTRIFVRNAQARIQNRINGARR